MQKYWQHAVNRAVIFLCRPYIKREWPGWGRLYTLAVESGRADRWANYPRRWVRGKLHGYEMSLNLGYFANRMTFFLERWSDLPTQLATQALLRPGDTMIDVGANEGMVSLLASKLVGPAGKIISFEPNPTPRKNLETAIDRNSISNITLYPIGLANSNDSLTLTAPKYNPGEGSFGIPAYDPKLVDTLECQVRRGDEVLGSVTPQLMKMDIEGFEPFALDGLRETIARAKPTIIMEVIAGHLFNANTSPSALRQRMDNLGYRSYRIGIAKQNGSYRLRLTPEIIGDKTRGDFVWLHKESRTTPREIEASA
jgi:FkbM family methyltransferase